MSGWSGSAGGGYWVGSQPAQTRRVTTSSTEVLHIAIAFLVLTIDIAIVVSGLLRSVQFGGFNPDAVFAGLSFGAAAALTGFLAHELAHKIVAQRLGFWAEFRMSPVGLLFSLVTALFGFLFAAPGATVVGGIGDARNWGRTSIAGPALNLVEGTVFAVAGLLLNTRSGLAGAAGFLVLLAFINGWFATFNLLPFGPLDGRKVLRWSTTIWVAVFAAAVAFTLLMLLTVSFGWPVKIGGL
jgi:Zn-dependent protease